MTISPVSCSLLAAAPGADSRMNENELGELLHLPNEKF